MTTSNIFIKKLYSKKTIKRIENKIKMLGPDTKININVFLTLKLILLILVFFLCIYIFKIGYIIAPIVTIILYFLYDYLFLDLSINKRADILEHDAIFFFEVLSLTLQSESNLKVCLEITTDAIDSELSKEFSQALKESKLGKSLNESLNDLKNRIPSKTVNNIILNLIESNVYGNSITSSLENQIEYITDKRMLEIKGKINKMPTKISIVSVLFFIPLILLLILSPVIINYFVK